MLSAHAVTHPQFFQAWQSPDSADPVLSREPSLDYIQLPVVSGYPALVRDEAFSAIQAQFLGDIQKLRQLAPNFVNYQYDDAIRTFYNKVKSPSYDSTGHLLPIYRETRYHIHQLVSMLENHQHTGTDQSEYIAIRLHDCLTDIDNCLAAVHSRFASSLINLEAGLRGLDGKMFQVRQELYQQCIASFMFQQERQALVIVPRGSQVHWSNALHNIYCQAIGLPPIVDTSAPSVLSEALTNRFLATAELSVSACTILRQLSAKWSDQLSSILYDLGIAAWETDVIEPSQITTDKTDTFDGKLFQSINHLLKTDEKQRLTLWNLIEENDDRSYRLDRHREKLLAWLSNHFCESAVQVFATIPAAVRGAPGACIGTIGKLFFWVFADDTALRAGQPCTFDTDNYISITLPHLITLDFNTWPNNTSYALLTQAMEQTDDPEDIASFFLNPAINAQLSKTPAPIIQTLSNQLVGKLVHNSDDFQKRLCQCVGDQLAQQQTITPQTLRWLLDTPILGQVLEALQGKPGLTSVTGELAPWQISDFSQDNIKSLLTDEDCKRLFRQAHRLNQPHILASLLLTGRCGESIENCQKGGINLLAFFALAGVLPGVEYLLKFTTQDVNGVCNSASPGPLFCAAKSGSIECLNALLAAPGIQVNKRRSPDGWTPLHVAVSYGHRACVIGLLEAGAEVHAKSASGISALIVAGRYGHIDCIESLLMAGGCPDNDSDNVKKEYCAHIPSHRAYVRELLETGSCRINDADSNGNTPLHSAAISGHSHCVRALLRAPGINVNPANGDGWTPLHFAVMYGHTGATEVLLCADGIQVNLITEARWTPLGCAAIYRHASCARVLLRHPDIQVNLKDRDQMTPLDHAVKYGYSPCLDVLLSAGADQVVNDLSVEGYTPLGMAAERGSWYCVTELLSVENIRVNERNSGGCTALHFAAERGHTACVKSLLGAGGIEIDVRNDGGWTPLDCAVKNGHVSCTKLLLSADLSRINDRNPAGNTLLCSAIIEGHYACVVALLGTAGILVNLGNNEGWTPLLCAIVSDRTQCLKLLLGKDGIPVNEVTETGWSPLTCAARHGREECIRLLMGTDGVDIKQRDLFHRTPLDHAVERNHKRCIQVLLSAGDCSVNDPVPNGLTPLCRAAKEGLDGPLEALLSAKNIEVNKSSPDGMTALHYCASHGHTQCLTLLLGAAGIKVNMKSAAGLFPLDLAIKYGHIDCAQALLETGAHQADMITVLAEGGPARERQYQTEDA